MCELILTEKARNVEHENDCVLVILYTAIGPEGMAFDQHIDIVLAFCRSLNIIISSPFIFLKPLDEMSPRLVGVNYRDHLLMLI